ncbi:MAG: DUF4301 family protein [Bacteroidales bacterium]
MITFSQKDQEFMLARGSNQESVKKQFSYFETGFDGAKLIRAAVPDDGILVLEEEQVEELAADFDWQMKGKSAVKFVPASGAASRMFKELYLYLESDDEAIAVKAKAFLLKINKFAFYYDLQNVMQRDGYSLQNEIEFQNYQLVIRYILDKVGLNYGNVPKGLLKFHTYGSQYRTPIEEHLVEAALYAKDEWGVCRLHFTVSPQHQSEFEKRLGEVQEEYEKRFKVRYEISFSIQNPSTDTLAAEENNQPFRDAQGNLLFRPGGHGALIHNLNQLKSDLVFIKNIDNVLTEDKIQTTVLYKKALAAYLIELQTQLFRYLKRLETGEVDEMDMCEILDFAETNLMISLGEDDLSVEELYKKLNRPIRVCGMVKKEGEPGGGPFWVENRAGEECLQIVESSQMNLKDLEQKTIVERSTHFNPVDMVCSFVDHRGHYFNLLDYVDESTGFISSKSYGERTLKAMELPGLWNGAMADWITVFVEIPLSTFNPVKTVFDLLKR